MLLSPKVCVFYLCLLLCDITTSTIINDGILISYSKNIRPARIEDTDRVVLAPSSSRLRCFAKCARDPHCTKSVRDNDDGTLEEVVNKVLTDWQPHANDYVLKCVTERSRGSGDKSSPPPQDDRKSPPPPHDGRKSPPPSQDSRKSPPPSQDSRKSPPPSQDGHKSPPPSQDGHKSPPPSQVGHQSAPPPPDVQISTDEGSHGPSKTGSVSVKYKVMTKTGNAAGSSTNSYVYLTLYGVNGSDELYLNNMDEEMRRGLVDTFRFSRSKDLGSIRKMEIRMETYMMLAKNWFCVWLELEYRRENTSHTRVEVYYSSLNRWFPSDRFKRNAFEIPQNIPFNLTKQSTHLL